MLAFVLSVDMGKQPPALILMLFADISLHIDCPVLDIIYFNI